MGWLAGWTYRKSHIINDATGAGSDYQIKFVVHSGSGSDSGEDVYLESHCTDFPNDITFTDNDGTTELKHWCEDPSADPAVFWVKVEDSLESSPVTIYIYYGKNGQGSSVDMSNTFPALADEFAGSAEPPDGWSEEQVGTLTWDDISENSYYKVYNFQDSSAEWHGNDIYKSVTPPTTFCVVSKHVVICSGTNDKPQTISELKGYLSGVQKVRIAFVDSWTAAIGAIYSNITGTDDNEAGDTRSGTTYILEIRRDGTNIKTYFNGTLQQTKVEATTFDEIRLRVVGGASLSSSDPQTELEWVFIRKFVDPEPAHSTWGSEETEPVAVSVGNSIVPLMKALDLI